MIGYETPARFRGQQSTIAVKVVDAAAAEKTLSTVLAEFPERFEERKFGDVTYHAFVIEWPEQLAEDPPSNPFLARASCSKGRLRPATARRSGWSTCRPTTSWWPRSSRRRRA
jgi:hypothetical protein